MCMYCERNGRDWEQMPPLPYMEQDRKAGQSAVTGNMISPRVYPIFCVKSITWCKAGQN